MRLMLLLLFSLRLYSADLSVYRHLLDQSLRSEAAAERLFEQLKDVKEDDQPVLLGFRAMSEFMLCKHILNPVSRIGHFNKGRGLLETAISKDSLNPELRYFRLSTQSNVPSFLRYKVNITEDKLQLISFLQTDTGRAGPDKQLYQRIKAYLLINPYCSTEEKAMIKNLKHD